MRNQDNQYSAHEDMWGQSNLQGDGPGVCTPEVKLACALPLFLEVVGTPFSCPDVSLSVMGAAAALEPVAPPASTRSAAASALTSCLPSTDVTCEIWIWAWSCSPGPELASWQPLAGGGMACTREGSASGKNHATGCPGSSTGLPSFSPPTVHIKSLYISKHGSAC